MKAESVVKYYVFNNKLIVGSNETLFKDELVASEVNFLTDNINDILYVGKSHEINKRIREHTIRASDRTYSLRLFEPDRTVFNGKYKIYIFKCLNEKYFKMILSTIESILHEKLTPIVGSKRV